VPSSALRALRALIAPASTAAQNQQPQNLQNGCCTNNGSSDFEAPSVYLDTVSTGLIDMHYV
jgi:hypothetical protein